MDKERLYFLEQVCPGSGGEFSNTVFEAFPIAFRY
jgi:hypothetical protein